MVKRSADGQLTRESWDEDEPSEKPEVGEFNRAPEDVLARRKILVARRRVPERKKEPEVNPFANFKGFKGLSFSTDSSTLAKSSSVTPTTSASFKSDGHDECSTADTVTADNSSSKASDVLPSSAEKGSDTSKPFSSVIFEPVIKRPSIDKNDIPSLWKQADIGGSHIEEQPGPRRDKRVIEFVSKIKALNGDFVEHIRKCFQLNPFINFKPNFDDYNEHMKSLQQEHGITDDDSLWIKPETLTKEATVGRRPFAETVSRAASKKSRTDASFVPTAASAVAKEQAGTVSAERKQTHGSGLFQPAQSLSKSIKLTTEATRTEREVGSQFKFSAFTKDSNDDGLKKNDVSLRDDGTKASSPIFKNVMSKPATSTDEKGASSSKSLFSFGLTKAAGGDNKKFFSSPVFSQSPLGVGVQQPPLFSGSLFPSVSARAVAEDKEEEDEEQGEDDAPPIVTQTILPEDGSIHDVRCKLYYMDDDKKYNDFGIGQLYVKPLTSGRVQLIIRADNSLGNLIFNVAIDQSTPITKAGKNGLSIVVVPNPPIKKASGDQPTVALLRVKTDVQLNELLDKIEEAKKEASCLRNLAKS